MDKKGKFFAFEGIDGCGKSTQIQILARRIREHTNTPVYITREPTEGPIGSLLRQVLTGRMKCDYRALPLLFAADRIDHLTNEVNGILPQLEEGIIVLCDRYYFSSYAYQSVDVTMSSVIEVNATSAKLCPPTATIYLDLDPEIALKRIAMGRLQQELFETKERLLDTYDGYEEAFRRLADEEDVLKFQADQSVESLSEDIWARVKWLL